jgi:hypothetical protein
MQNILERKFQGWDSGAMPEPAVPPAFRPLAALCP